jgi:hypothetical protein
MASSIFFPENMLEIMLTLMLCAKFGDWLEVLWETVEIFSQPKSPILELVGSHSNCIYM